MVPDLRQGTENHKTNENRCANALKYEPYHRTLQHTGANLAVAHFSGHGRVMKRPEFCLI